MLRSNNIMRKNASSLLLLTLAAPMNAAAYLPPGRARGTAWPGRTTWDTFELEQLEQSREVTQPPLSEKALWERALERQIQEASLERQIREAFESEKPPPPSPESEVPAARTRKNRKSSWEEVMELAATGDVARGRIVSTNRGGAICRVRGQNAFLPNSHLGLAPGEDRSAIVGRTLPVKVVRAEAGARRAVVSHREARRDALRRGDVVRGAVSSHLPCGTLVDLGGGLRGLLRRRNITLQGWKLVRHGPGYRVDECFRNEWETPGTLLEVGSEVACLVTRHDRGSGRISLSTRALEPEPGDLLRDPRGVFEQAEATIRERRARELLADEILVKVCPDKPLSSLISDLFP